jgi:hypothetical protein
MLGAAVAFSTAHFFYSNQLLAGAETGTSLGGGRSRSTAPRHTGRHRSTLRDSLWRTAAVHHDGASRSGDPPLDLDRRLSARVPCASAGMSLTGAAFSVRTVSDKTFFVWMNTTHMHAFTHTKPESIGQAVDAGSHRTTTR